MEKLGKLSGEPDALRYKADRATIFGKADRLKYENPVKEITDDYFGRYLDVGMKEPIASSEIMKNGAAFEMLIIHSIPVQKALKSRPRTSQRISAQVKTSKKKSTTRVSG